MKKKIFSATALLLSSFLLITLAGCLPKTEKQAISHSGTQEELPPVTLKILLWGEPPTHMSKVLEEFDRRTKNTLNVKLDIEWSSLEEHKRRLELMQATGEEVDIVFDASFVSLIPNVSRGAYVKLDSYFNNDEYPGLKHAFPKELLEGNKINGNVYTVPLLQYYNTIDGIFIRKDLREKYGLPPIRNYDDLKKFYDKMLENEKHTVPLAIEGRRGFYTMLPLEGTPGNVILGSSYGSGIHWNFMLSEDRKKVLGITTIGDPDSEFAAFTPPYNKHAFVYSRYSTFVDWNKYVEMDSISQKDKQGLFVSGKAASLESDILQYNHVKLKLKENVPQGELEFFPFRACARKGERQCGGKLERASNSLSISATSKHIERSLMFLDWIFRDQANHDLFEYGVEGKDWKAVGEDQYDPISNYYFPGYQLTWNPAMIRVRADMEESIKPYFKYLENPGNYAVSSHKEFKFNLDPVKLEIAKVSASAVYNEFLQRASNGLVKDFDNEARQVNLELRSLGLNAIRQELKKQFQEFLDQSK